MSTAWQDTFASRTISSNTTGNWGTASDGESWSVYGSVGTNNNYAVASGEGTFQNPTGGTPIVIMKLGTNTGTDMEVSCRISGGASNDSIYVFTRITDATHYYRLDFTGTSLQLGMKNAGSFTSIKSVSAGLTLAAGTFYWFRLRVIGTTFYGKVWQDGNTEPQSWTLTTTDATIASGGVGLGASPHSATNNTQFDTFNAITFDASLSDAASFDDSAFSSTASPKQIDSNSFNETTTVSTSKTTTDTVSLVEATAATSSSTTTDTNTLAESSNTTSVTAPLLIWTDTFAGRTVSSNTTANLGTASDGEAYTCLSGLGANTVFAVTSGEGLINSTSGGQIVIMKLGSTIGTDMMTTMRLSPGSPTDTISVFVRLTDSTHYYRIATAGGNTTVSLGMKNGGAFTGLANSANMGFTIAAGTFYLLKIMVVGTALSGKIWIDGTPEPSAWNVTATDATIAYGGTGFGCNVNSTTNVQFDSFTAFTIDAHSDNNDTISDTASLVDATTVTDANNAVEATTATSNSAITETSLLPSDTFTDTSAISGVNLNNSYKNVILSDSPLSYYRLDESSGTTVFDATANARNGTIHGSVSLSQVGALTGIGDADSSMLFDGSTGYITLPQTNLPAGGNLWSIEAWAMINTIPVNNHKGCLIGFGSYATHEMAILFVNGVGGTSAQSYLSTFSGDLGGPAMALGNWYHVVATFDGTKINIYQNGSLYSSATETPNIVTSFASIGASNTGPQDYVNGYVDEVAIYSYALTPTQILAHYNAGTKGASASYESYTETISETSSDTITFDDSAFSDTSVAKPFDTGNLTDAINDTASSTMTDSGSVTDTSGNTSNTTRTSSLSLVDAFNDVVAESPVDSISIVEGSLVTESPALTEVVATTYTETILGDTPLAYYRLDEANGTTVYDFTSSGRNGALSGTGTVQGTSGLLQIDSDASYTFNGSGYISLPLNFTPTGASPWSIEAWCTIASVPVGYACICGFGKQPGTNQQGALLLIHNNGATGQAVLSLFGGDIGGSTIIVGPTYHIVGTYDGTSTRLYVNGTIVAGPSAFTPNIISAFASIGADRAGGGSDRYNGTIDEVALYGYALTATQVTTHYQVGSSDKSDVLALTDIATHTNTPLVAVESLSTTEKTTTTDSGSITDAPAFTDIPKLTDIAPFQSEAITIAEIESLIDSFSLDDARTNLVISEIQNDTPASLTEASTTNTALTGGIVQWSDTFSGRTVATNTSGNWGQASNGEFWSCLSGNSSPTTLSVANGEGTISEATGSGIVIMRLGQKSAADTETLCRIAPGVSNDSIYVFTRLIDSTHYYRMDFTGSNLQIAKKAGGGFTSLLSSNIGLTSTPGTFYWLRFRVVGTTLFGKVWVDGTLEPISWLVTATDTSNATGGVGCGCNPQSSTNVQFDSFSAYTVIPADATFVDFITLAENISLTDPYQFLDNIFLIDVNSTKLLYTMTTCRSGFTTTSSRGN